KNAARRELRRRPRLTPFRVRRLPRPPPRGASMTDTGSGALGQPRVPGADAIVEGQLGRADGERVLHPPATVRNAPDLCLLVSSPPSFGRQRRERLAPGVVGEQTAWTVW